MYRLGLISYSNYGTKLDACHIIWQISSEQIAIYATNLMKLVTGDYEQIE